VLRESSLNKSSNGSATKHTDNFDMSDENDDDDVPSTKTTRGRGRGRGRASKTARGTTRGRGSRGGRGKNAAAKSELDTTSTQKSIQSCKLSN